MEKKINIRLDEQMFTELVQGKMVVVEGDLVKVQIILADIGYTKMLDILENALDDLAKTGGSDRFEKVKVRICPNQRFAVDVTAPNDLSAKSVIADEFSPKENEIWEAEIINNQFKLIRKN